MKFSCRCKIEGRTLSDAPKFKSENITAFVSGAGNLIFSELKQGKTACTEAIKLAHWILETFEKEGE